MWSTCTPTARQTAPTAWTVYGADSASGPWTELSKVDDYEDGVAEAPMSEYRDSFYWAACGAAEPETAPQPYACKPYFCNPRANTGYLGNYVTVVHTKTGAGRPTADARIVERESFVLSEVRPSAAGGGHPC